MKAIILLVNGIIIALIASLFSRTMPMPTEFDSVKAICAISKEDCDYDLYLNGIGQVFRNGAERRAFIGDAENGMSFDGDQAYQYIDGKKTQVPEFPFGEYDTYAQKLLQISQTILSQKLYSAYNDERIGYQQQYFYFKLSEVGLALFSDHAFTSGRITCYFRDHKFLTFEISLYEDNSDKPDVLCTFGTIDYSVVVSPVTLPNLEPSNDPAA